MIQTSGFAAVRGFPNFASCLAPGVSKPARQKLPSGFIRFDVHALKAGISLRVLCPFISCAEAKSATAPELLPLTPRHAGPPDGALRHHTPANHRICRPLRITAPLGATPLARLRRARAGFEHAARCAKRVPRRRPGDASGNAAQTGGLGAASAAKDEPALQARAPRALLLLF